MHYSRTGERTPRSPVLRWYAGLTMKDFYVADAPRFDAQTVTGFFILSQICLRDTKNGGKYLALTLSDKTGALEARMWEEFLEPFESCKESCYVKVQGQISRYQERWQITIKKMKSASDLELDPTDFQKATDYPGGVDAMDRELRTIVAAFEDQNLKRLVLSFLDDPLIGPLFRTAPAAQRLHHAWIGGLIEHVLALSKVCLAAAPFYPLVNRDLLVTGAILHDMGKVRELVWKSSFGYALEGQLLGHITIVQRILAEKMIELAPFPEKLRLLVEHMIVSHHGRLEFGSPKLPMTPEAILLSALDDLEAKFAALNREFDAAEAAGKGPSDTTDWVRSMDRPLFNSQRWMSEQ